MVLSVPVDAPKIVGLRVVFSFFLEGNDMTEWISESYDVFEKRVPNPRAAVGTFSVLRFPLSLPSFSFSSPSFSPFVSTPLHSFEPAPAREAEKASGHLKEERAERKKRRDDASSFLSRVLAGW